MIRHLIAEQPARRNGGRSRASSSAAKASRAAAVAKVKWWARETWQSLYPLAEGVFSRATLLESRDRRLQQRVPYEREETVSGTKLSCKLNSASLFQPQPP